MTQAIRQLINRINGKYNVDGFKFDGETIENHSNSMLASKGKIGDAYSPAERNIH